MKDLIKKFGDAKKITENEVAAAVLCLAEVLCDVEFQLSEIDRSLECLNENIHSSDEK